MNQEGLLYWRRERATSAHVIEMAQERAKAGAVMLDEHKPGWYKRIDPQTLNLASTNDCIWGQLFGGFANASTFLPSDIFWDGGRYGVAEYPGINWTTLTDAWLVEIGNRLDADAKTLETEMAALQHDSSELVGL